MAGVKNSKDTLSEELLHYYDHFDEKDRLQIGFGKLEKSRTQDILIRQLPPAPAVIMDVGGGTGVYSFWLAEQGYQVHLVDPVPLHVEQAKEEAKKHTVHPLASIRIGQASRIDHPDSSMDAMLLFGPMYHLTERNDRLKALQEVRRLLKKEGWVFAAGISRFASILDGFFHGYIEDPEFIRIVERDLQNGQHRNPTNNLVYFTTSYFHLPQELASEIRESGLSLKTLMAVEGTGWLLHDFDAHWNDPNRRKRLLDSIRRLEEEPSLLGASAHIMAVAKKVT